MTKYLQFLCKGLGAIRAKIGPTSDVDKIFSKYLFLDTAATSKRERR
jgi:hypothetical protein